MFIVLVKHTKPNGGKIIKMKNKNVLKIIRLNLQDRVYNAMKQTEFSAEALCREFNAEGIQITTQSIRKFIRKTKIHKRKIKKTKFKEMYHNKEKKNCPNKKFVNKILTRILIKLANNLRVNPKKLKCCLLDGEDFGTTKTLLKRGVRRDNIHIPNPFLYKKMKKTNLVPVHNLLFKDFIEIAKQKYHLLYPDYCCTADGNEMMSPLVDFKKCFDLKLFKDVSIIATTLSARKNTKATYSGEDYNKVLANINKYASENGYIAKLIWNFKYKGMYHMVFGVSIPKYHKVIDELNPFSY